MEECKQAEGRKTVAEEIIELITIVANKAEGFQNDMRHKLVSICSVEEPLAEVPGLRTIKSYPPLFGTLRVKILEIEETIDAMSRVLSRVEL